MKLSSFRHIAILVLVGCTNSQDPSTPETSIGSLNAIAQSPDLEPWVVLFCSFTADNPGIAEQYGQWDFYMHKEGGMGDLPNNCVSAYDAMSCYDRAEVDGVERYFYSGDFGSEVLTINADGSARYISTRNDEPADSDRVNPLTYSGTCVRGPDHE